jgi:hypothetical protein
MRERERERENERMREKETGNSKGLNARTSYWLCSCEMREQM